MNDKAGGSAYAGENALGFLVRMFYVDTDIKDIPGSTESRGNSKE